MNVLKNIDKYFEEKPQKEFIYFVLMIVILIAFLMYYFIYPLANKYESFEENRYNELITKINNLNVKLNVFMARKTILIKRNKEKKSLLASLEKKKIFYSELANLLDFAEFDQYKWANIVKSIVDSAKEKGLILKDVYNKIYDLNLSTGKDMPNIVKRMDIGVALKGSYRDFVYYLYGYENRKELIRVKDMNITSPTSFMVTFSIYGYNK